MERGEGTERVWGALKVRHSHEIATLSSNTMPIGVLMVRILLIYNVIHCIMQPQWKNIIYLLLL